MAAPLSRQEAEAFLLKGHKLADSLDQNRWLDELWAEDATLEFGNHPLIRGRNEIKKFFEGQFSLLKSMKHEIVYFNVIGETIYQKANITYLVKGSDSNGAALQPVTISGFAIFKTRLEDKRRLGGFEVYMDPTPLLKAIQEAQSRSTDQVIDLLE